ncbi:SDR family NAD(P)-dependent oxidoreductase [Nocardia sp. NPDC052112]|uniref:SDR family NAD(P)-dependent oxidoreductase n=1 Tax=Nocardia sp. NPDC052112 TaxID=3155646 RepID=UPI0034133CE7
MSLPELQRNRNRFDLSGRAALVTGAGGGIGAAVATALAEQGAAVLVTDLDAAAAATTAERIITDGGHAASVALDVRDPEAADAAVAAAAELAGGTLHIVVNNAGVTAPAMFGKTTEESVRQLLDIHVLGAFRCAQAALAYLPTDGTGRIINVTSSAGLAGALGQVNYSAAKSAIVGLTKSLARELARKQITVNALAPAAATAMTAKIRTDPKFAEKMLDRIPLRRWAEPDEVAGAFVFLASDAASYITGQILPVDGGLVM